MATDGMTQDRPRMRRFAPLLVAAASAVGLIVLLLSPGSPGPSPPASREAGAGRDCGPATRLLGVGHSLPASCKVEELDGGRVVTLGEIQKGKPMVLNFWASWCSFCIQEMPDFQRVYGSFGGRVEFVGVDLLGVQGETRNAARRFARQTEVRYPLVFDEKGLLYSRFVGTRLAMPTTIFVRPDGTVAHGISGPLSGDDLRALIGEKLGV